MSRHYSEEDLILYYYEERPRSAGIQQHLDSCGQCAAAYRDLVATLKLVATPEAPDRGDQYGLEVWQRIRHRLPDRERAWWPEPVSSFEGRLVAMVTFAALVGGAFLLGLETESEFL